MSENHLKLLVIGLSRHYSNAEDTEKIIINCALIAAGADAIGGSIPVLAIPATIMSCVGAVWGMYIKLCSTLGISLKANALKLLAKAALANIAANLGGLLVGIVAGMLFPGASIAVSAVVTFLAVYLAGIVFLAMILKMAERSSDPYSFSDVSMDEMKKAVSGTKLTKEDLNEAKNAFEANK